MRVGRIVSGGQTGVDRAALEFAMARGIPYGGWCPAGGWAEDAVVPPGVLTRFPDLRETPSRDPAQRTEWNVRDSDATLVVIDRLGASTPAGPGDDSPGTRLTEQAARELGRPLLTIAVDDPSGVERVTAFLDRVVATGRLAEAGGITLNVAGPRESEVPGIRIATRTLLDTLADVLAPPRPGG